MADESPLSEAEAHSASSTGIKSWLTHPDAAPFLVMAAGVILAIVLVIAKPKAIPEPIAEPSAPVVDWIAATPQHQTITVETQGTVQPRLSIDLVARVAGNIDSVNPHFAEGGFFNVDDALVSIEPQDYQYALVRAESRVADAKQNLATEKGRAKQAKREWRDLGDKESNDLFLRKPQLAGAKASLNAAIADYEQAKLDLQRTSIHAPFNGRIWKKYVDAGQYLTPGTPVAKIYASDKVEVRLPLTNSQVGLVDLPLASSNLSHGDLPDVLFTAEFGRQRHHWQGKIVRTEASIDTESRVIFAVAEVENPFVNTAQAPMAIGLFVEAKIEGRQFDQLLTLPRDALLQSQQIYTVDSEQRLVLIDVDVLQSNPQEAIIRTAITPNTIVVTSYVPFAYEGLKVKLRDFDLAIDTASSLTSDSVSNSAIKLKAETE